MLEEIARHCGLLKAVALRAGVDIASEYWDGRLSAPELRGAIRRCIGCAQAADCSGFLCRNGRAIPEIPTYCPNKPLISALKPRPPRPQ